MYSGAKFAATEENNRLSVGQDLVALNCIWRTVILGTAFKFKVVFEKHSTCNRFDHVLLKTPSQHLNGRRHDQGI